MKYIIESILFLLSITMSQNSIWAYQNTIPEHTDSLALDPSIRYGHLPNGLTYYIKDVKDVSKKVEMRLYVKVGSFYQGPEELEFAHTLEHLAFKCAKVFPFNLLNAPSDFLSGLGIRDKDIQAHTWFTSTWYNIKNIPSDSMKTIDIGLLWFSNLTNLNLTNKVINKERKVLEQETIYRMGNNLESYFLKTRLNSLLNPCDYDMSDFFGNNKNYSPESLIGFYKRWYRPDRMGIVIVGDIADVHAVEKQIKKHFLGVKAHQIAEQWSDCRLKYLDSPKRFVILNRDQNKIVGDKHVALSFYKRNRDIMLHRQGWKGLQSELVWNILNRIINYRFKRVSKSYKSSFSASYYPPRQFSPASEIRIETTEGQEQEAIGKVVQILKNLKNMGLTSEEWEQAKAEEMTSLEPVDTKSYYLEHIANHFLYEQALPANRTIRLQRWLSQLSVEEFNALCRKHIAGIPDDIGIIAPAGKSYTEADVHAWINQALEEEILPLPVPKVPAQLMSKKRLSSFRKVGYTDLGTIASGAREFMLDNGVRIVLDTTSSNKSKVSLHGFNTEGAACFREKDYFSAINAPGIVKNAGVGPMDKFALYRFLEKTGVWQGTGPYIDYGESGIRGKSAIEDLEYMLQLVYLYFTHPRKNMEAFEDWRQNEIERHLNPAYSIISEDFDILMGRFLGDHTKIPQGTKRLHGMTKTDMDTAYKIYRKLFGNASDFTFLLSGGFSINEALPLLQKYLGNLPNNSYKLSCSSKQNMTYALPKGPLYKEFHARKIDASYTMRSVRYSLCYLAKTEGQLDWKEQIKLMVLGEYMNSKIKELRTSHGAALYTMRAFTFFQKENYELRMSMDCIPEELGMLRKLCKEMIEEVKNGTFNQAQIEMVLNSGNLKIPQSTNYHYYRYKEPLVKMVDVEHYVRSLTPKDIREAAQKYLKDENLMEFVFRDNIISP
ncbi:M16 family metallopeptidase [Sinomicrobium oceani]|uniref:M16 family metallopeptidase n=1 Tax=Sinomicrobium oceani TaxID=1150368 RepID=UPI00227CD7D7|nr:insulinase family protein [Sinomicrobium oceani]